MAPSSECFKTKFYSTRLHDLDIIQNFTFQDVSSDDSVEGDGFSQDTQTWWRATMEVWPVICMYVCMFIKTLCNHGIDNGIDMSFP